MTSILLATRIQPNQTIVVFKNRTGECIFYGEASEFLDSRYERYHSYIVSDIFTFAKEDRIYIEIDWRRQP